jgi:NAD(P)-dependent dehydrogenase (short-subunit alcohol dehydrogenase family)
MRLRDKVIIVTGSTTGIGKAIARRALAEGARVLIHGRDRQRGEALLREAGERAALHVDDLADPGSAGRLVSVALKVFGRLDCLVNNAAYIVRSTLETTDAELFDRVMAINVRAPLLLIKAAAEELKKSQGCVLNIGSLNAYCGENNLLAYSASKGALMTVSRNLADALARSRVRVNHFNVGWVLTENEYHYKIADGLPKDWPEHVDPVVAPSGGLMSPDRIAEAAIYWLSDESRPISGSVVDLEQYPFLGRNPSKEVVD